MDYTLAITAHSEGIVAGPTLLSAEKAILAAEKEGFTVERLIGLDSPSDECVSFFRQPALKNWRLVDLSVRDLGLARNSLAHEAQGKWIAFLDADDLFSENWLVLSAELLISADKVGSNLVLHPELNIFFDAAYSVLSNIGQNHPHFVPNYWYISNYFDSLIIAPRRAFLEVPYACRDKEKGFGYEDWRWNLDTIEQGWEHVLVKDTIIFKRRRDSSLVVDLGKDRSLLWDLSSLAIDQLKGAHSAQIE